MGQKPTVETLAVQLEMHRQEFQNSERRSQRAHVELREEVLKAEERSRKSRENLLKKIEMVGDTVTEGLKGVHQRVDQVITDEKTRERDFYQGAIRWVAGAFSTVFIFLLGIIGWLLVNGQPWLTS